MAAQSREEPEPYSLPARMSSGVPSARYFSRGVEDRHLGVRRQVAGESAFGLHQPVTQADVGEGAAHHHFVIAAAGAVGVEVGGLHAVFLQIFSGGTVFLDRSCGRDVVGGDAVAENCEDAGVVDVFDWSGLHVHVVEVGGASNVGGVSGPRRRSHPSGTAESAPALVALKDFAIRLFEHLGSDGVLHGFFDFARTGPDVGKIDRLAVLTFAEGIFAQVDVDSCRPARKRRPAAGTSGSSRELRS